MRLDSLSEGCEAIVLSVRTDGTMRRRLLDFGLIDGTKISCLRKANGCALYRVRGVVLALRFADASKICVRPCD